MRPVSAYATAGPKDPFQKTTIERRDLGPLDVLIEIAFVGICHTDIHVARNDWNKTLYPLVPGHEIAGTVEAVGAAVDRYSVGDRVGVGCMVDSCRECVHCRAGEEQYCAEGKVNTYNAIGRDGRPTEGGYATHIVVDQAFVVRIPEGISLDAAAPLLCAGITVYSPLRHWRAAAGKQVAIVGMGGLGHMGVKIAHAMEAEVSVLSRTLSKQADARRYGADHYYATSDDATFAQRQGHFDLILNTVSAELPIDAYLNLLALDGALVNVGAPAATLQLHAFSLLRNRRSFAGSAIGGIRETQEMLDFCARHGLGAEVEVISSGEIDLAYDRVIASNVRYRFVIDAATF